LELVVEVEVPVDLDRARDVAGVVEEDVLVGLHDHHAGVVAVLGHPVGADQHLGVGVLLKLGGRIGGYGHGASWGRSSGFPTNVVGFVANRGPARGKLRR
jgi:hypothetical protein